MISSSILFIMLSYPIYPQGVAAYAAAQRPQYKEPTQSRRKIKKDCLKLGIIRHLLAPPKRKPLPEYPVEAKQKGVSGNVEVVVYVSEEGKVYSAAVCNGPVSLRQAALNAASNAEFEPVKYEGRPVKVMTLLTYEFSTH